MAKHKNNTPEKPALPPQEALYQAVSLCRKAGALTMGFDAVEDACVKGKAWLVMVASDARRDHHAADAGPAGRYQPQTGGGVRRDRPQPRKALL